DKEPWLEGSSSSSDVLLIAGGVMVTGMKPSTALLAVSIKSISNVPALTGGVPVKATSKLAVPPGATSCTTPVKLVKPRSDGRPTVVKPTFTGNVEVVETAFTIAVVRSVEETDVSNTNGLPPLSTAPVKRPMADNQVFSP